MNFAREGLVFIVGSALIAAAVILVAVTKRSWPIWLLGFVLLVVAIWVASFFRDPERPGARGDQIVISPADGKVVLVTEVDEPTFVKGRAQRVSIFMNIFNVHVNRYPVTGVVQYVQANPGRFLNAVAPEASLENEQTSVGIELPPSHSEPFAGRPERSEGVGLTQGTLREGGPLRSAQSDKPTRILVRQIAGLIARRIVTYSRVGDEAKQGDRMGLIRFGSRVDVFVPLDATLRVKPGDVAYAGVTLLAELRRR